MAGKDKTVYVCSECGYEAAKWSGQCLSCGSWNTMNEEFRGANKTGHAAGGKASIRAAKSHKLGEIDPQNETRYPTGLAELDRVLGGGIVRGGLMLIGGDPGIGKSTLLLQICGYLADKMQVLYVSGEESERQIKLRADRLGVRG